MLFCQDVCINATGDGAALPQHDKIRIMIFDDGTGFDTAALYAASGLHFGMRGMEMRAKLLGGTLTIISKLETGTEVRVEVPREWVDITI